MDRIITFGQPKNIREFALIFTETLLTLWLPRFGIPLNHLESMVNGITGKAEAVVGSPLADLPLTDNENPMELALQKHEDALRFLMDGKPIDEDKIVRVGTGLMLGLISSKAGLEDTIVVPEEYFLEMVDENLSA